MRKIWLLVSGDDWQSGYHVERAYERLEDAEAYCKSMDPNAKTVAEREEWEREHPGWKTFIIPMEIDLLDVELYGPGEGRDYVPPPPPTTCQFCGRPPTHGDGYCDICWKEYGVGE